MTLELLRDLKKCFQRKKVLSTLSQIFSWASFVCPGITRKSESTDVSSPQDSVVFL